ncbi:hypothetical protein [Listeria fleischmannii]|uniref:hypothetical protein n=1 Tax=Listeria fleischmannii TaxID=1069827 RepID=UPI0016272CBF|nr:hypothetical protein [Listeria fleischmannii]MBC1419091.1 hypothetical protein [Listeria fleischmannii]
MTEHVLTDTLTTLDQLQAGTYLKTRHYLPKSEDGQMEDIGWLPAYETVSLKAINLIQIKYLKGLTMKALSIFKIANTSLLKTATLSI